MYLFRKKVHLKIQKFLLQHGILTSVSFCVSAVLLILLFLNLKSSQSDSDTIQQLTRNQVEPLAYACCTPLNHSLRTNLFFVKPHKTGSSTVKNVIMRFALLNSLDAMKIIYHTYYWPFSDFSINPNTRTPNNKYHIMAQHVRYDSKLKSYQYPNTPTVTIIRHPVTHFQSKYDFFTMNKTTGMSLEEFLKAPRKPEVLLGPDSNLVYRGYNEMSVDLGFDPTQSKNEIAIGEFIEKLDRELDFVMIMEHMEESMILLANLMGWPLEKVTYLKKNARLPGSDTYELTPLDEFTIMELNKVDASLYNHFNNKFQKCLRQYGEQKMNQQLQRLRILNEQFARRCVTGEVEQKMWWHDAPKVAGYLPKNLSDLECFYMLSSTDVLDNTANQQIFQRYGWFGLGPQTLPTAQKYIQGEQKYRVPP